jgi:hypothetical protein
MMHCYDSSLIQGQALCGLRCCHFDDGQNQPLVWHMFDGKSVSAN